MKSIPLHSPLLLLIKDVWSYLDSNRKTQLCFAFLVMLLSALIELLSLGSIVPFLSVLSNPSYLDNNPFFKYTSSQFDFITFDNALLILSLIFCLFTVLASLARLFNLWINTKISALIGTDLSSKAYMHELYQPYSYFQNSSEVISSVTNQASRTVQALNSFLQLITSFFVTISLLIGLLIINPAVALLAISLFGCSYFSLQALFVKSLFQIVVILLLLLKSD